MTDARRDRIEAERLALMRAARAMLDAGSWQADVDARLAVRKLLETIAEADRLELAKGNP